MNAPELIARLRMEKIPDEGAWFALTYVSADIIPASGLPARYGGARPAGNAIYALVTREDFSAMHRLKTDETWHFYAGDPIELLLLHPDGREELVLLGPALHAGQRFQFTVPAGTWMGARPQSDAAGAFSLFGCSMSPGFDYADFEPGYRNELEKQHPARASLIASLTRTEFATRP